MGHLLAAASQLCFRGCVRLLVEYGLPAIAVICLIALPWATWRNEARRDSWARGPVEVRRADDDHRPPPDDTTTGWL